MTKEEILARLQNDNPSSIPIFKAMDEYAKQQAIAFVRWAIDEEKIVGNSAGSAFTNEPEDELYTQFSEYQFIEQQNKP
jgi:hypothetical protein